MSNMLSATKIRPDWSKSLICRIFTVEFSFLFPSPYHVNNSGGGRAVGWRRTVPVVAAREDFVNEHPVLTSAAREHRAVIVAV